MAPIGVSAGEYSGVRRVQTLYGRHGFVALTAAIDFHLLAVAAYFLSALLSGRGQPDGILRDPIIIIDGCPKIPPGNIIPHGRLIPARRKGPGISAAPSTPLPVMVDDSEFAAASGAENSPATDPIDAAGNAGGSSSGGNEGTSASPPAFEAGQAAPIFDAVEKPPIPFKIVKPDYPDEARRFALEGVVWIKALVEKDGSVTKAVVLQSTNDMFNDRASQAALRWVFVPGMMSSGPVRVWTAIPFRFRLEK